MHAPVSAQVVGGLVLLRYNVKNASMSGLGTRRVFWQGRIPDARIPQSRAQLDTGTAPPEPGSAVRAIGVDRGPLLLF